MQNFKSNLAGIGGGTECVPEGYRPGKPVTRRAPEGAVLQRNVLQKKGKLKIKVVLFF